MRRVGKFIARLLTLVVGIVLVVYLGSTAYNSTRDLIRNYNANRLHADQQTVFPGTATVIAQIYSRIDFEKTHAPSPTVTPTIDANTDAGSGSASDVATVPSGEDTQQQVAQLETPIALSTDAGVTVAVATIDTGSDAGNSVGSASGSANATNMDIPTLTATASNSPLPLPTDTPTTADTSAVIPSATSGATQTAPPPKLVAQLPPATNTKRPSLTPIVVQGGDTLTATTAPSNEPAIPAANSITNTATAAPITQTPAETIDVAAIGPTHKLPSVNLPAARTEKPQVTAIPSPAPRLKAPNGDDVLNIVLLGSDQDDNPSDPSFRTDSILIVSIDRTRNTVSMLSVPRDLFVYIPSLGMQRINTAFQWGEAVKWSPGGGFGLLQQTILYNLGIPVHYYALISFDGFKQIVDTYHGVDVAVDCPISDLRFQGQYDAQQTPIYSPYTLGVGFYHMDGSLALWYARMRHDTSDFDRSRRQQQVLRAILRTAREQGLLANAPALWGQITSIVKTNMQLPDVLGLVPIALSLKPSDITSYYMQKGYELMHWRTPQGEDVQLPDPKGFFQTINNFYTPPTKNRLDEDNLGVDVINGTSNKDWDKVAADRLAWEGFNPQAKGTGDPADKTVIYDYTGSAKPALLGVMMKALNVKPSQVVSQPDPSRTVDFKVVLGKDYNSCSVPGFGTS